MSFSIQNAGKRSDCHTAKKRGKNSDILKQPQYQRQKFASNEVKSESCKLAQNYYSSSFCPGGAWRSGARGVCAMFPNEIELNAFVVSVQPEGLPGASSPLGKTNVLCLAILFRWLKTGA